MTTTTKIIIGVVVASAVIGGAYYFYKKNKDNKAKGDVLRNDKDLPKDDKALPKQPIPTITTSETIKPHIPNFIKGIV